LAALCASATSAAVLNEEVGVLGDRLDAAGLPMVSPCTVGTDDSLCGAGGALR
jgi:hypothetical protein